MSTIYLSCAHQDYPTNEIFERYITETMFPNQDIRIINPKHIKIDESDIKHNLNNIAFKINEMKLLNKYFLPLIITSNYVVAFAHNGIFTPCVKQEMRFARFNDIDVYEISELQ